MLPEKQTSFFLSVSGNLSRILGSKACLSKYAGMPQFLIIFTKLLENKKMRQYKLLEISSQYDQYLRRFYNAHKDIETLSYEELNIRNIFPTQIHMHW